MSLMPIVPDLVIVVLAVWLGASVLLRTPRYQVSRVFCLMALLMGLWSAARVVWRLTDDEGVRRALMSAEAGVGTLIPAALLHLVLAFTAGRRWWWWQRLALLAAYSVGVAVGLLNATDLDHPLAVRPPYREVAGIPGPVLGWGWIGFRALVLGMSVWWAGRAWHREGRAGARRGQLGAVLAMVVCGTAGAVVMILSRQLGGPDWPGPH